MNFSIPKEKFAQILYLTTSIVEQRNTMPILANVKLTAEDGKLTVAATDLEVSLVGEAECSVKTPGSITVDAKKIYEIVKEFPNDLVTVSLAKGLRLDIQCGKNATKLNGTSAEEFPSVAGIALSKPVSVDAQMFYDMFDKTMFAVSTDETRYNINGVFVESVKQEKNGAARTIRFVATDGHRLAMVDSPAEGFSVLEPVIVPRKGIQEIKKVLEGNDGAASVEVREGFFTVQSGRVTLGVRLVDGQFPDYRQVIPKESKSIVTVDRLAFLGAVKRVSILTTDKTKAVRCRFEGNTLTLSSSSPEYGEATESVTMEKDGEDLTIGFSARYLMDAFNALQEHETVTIRLNGDLGPGMFLGGEDEAFTCIVMPMRFE